MCLFSLKCSFMQEVTFTVSVGRRLAEIRKDKDERQPEFARKLGVSESAYKNYERGERDLPLKTAKDICERYDVNPAWLLLGNGVKYGSEIKPLLQKCESAVSTFIDKNPGDQFVLSQRNELMGVITSLALKSGKLPFAEMQDILKVLKK